MLFRSNTKVDHPSKGEKDKADALAGATYMCITNFGTTQDVEIEIWGADTIEDEMYDGEDAIEAITKKPSDQANPVREMPSDLEEWLIEMI